MPGGVGGMPLMSVQDAESALAAARKETEKLEKGLNAVIRRNRRLLLGTRVAESYMAGNCIMGRR
ncbi:hypothetical protein L249_8539 [Ophiocordyceps polyrhachis-furcata BCC 54312]|uniref:Uncharacterized protein n=1 Tax=Ophiocordyceps polyrhachis-furcata BCC 54312 TaxID=1330021 RepID=A0A367L731_9HYPO|nr:hypothetical protein L249_8539 [Ophiocordyceps polyrhachis-furcata BCC 54312]